MQLEQVVTIVRDVLEGDLAGAYLFGSAVLGGVRPRSDLDVLAVSGGDPPEPPRPVELTIVAQPDVTPWRYRPRRDFQYGEWHAS